MSLAEQLSRQLEDPKLDQEERARLRCRIAGELEEAGDYEAARQAMGDLWRRVGEYPKLDALDEVTRAEVLLRAGTLTG